MWRYGEVSGETNASLWQSQQHRQVRAELDPAGDGRQLELRIDLAADAEELPVGLEPGEELSEV